MAHHSVAGSDDLAAPGPDGHISGFAGALVVSGDDMTGAVAFCRHLRLREVPMTPLLLLIASDQVSELLLRDDLYDDFCVLPARPEELVARLGHLFWRTGQSMRPDIIEYGPLMLNLETYQSPRQTRSAARRRRAPAGGRTAARQTTVRGSGMRR